MENSINTVLYYYSMVAPNVKEGCVLRDCDGRSLYLRISKPSVTVYILIIY